MVYFVRAGEDGLIKIGETSVAPRHRLDALKIGSSEDLHLLGVIRPTGPNLEKELHARFAHLRKRGEWFRPDPSLLGYIAAHATPWVPEPKPAPSPRADSDISDRLRRLLKRQGFSIREAAMFSGMESQQAWRIVTGKTADPRVESLRRLVEGVGATLGELFADEEGDRG